MFRQVFIQVSDLEETLERLESRCSRFVKGSRKYKEGVNSLAQAQMSFADFLEEFCGGGDEESMMLGMLHGNSQQLYHHLTSQHCSICAACSTDHHAAALHEAYVHS